jgi:hypothetical protein
MMMKNLTRPEVMDLDLFDTLADHVELSGKTLAKKVIGRGKDKRRAFTGTLRATIYQRDNGACFYCNASVNGVWDADHVIPWARGGRTVAENGVVACRRCNRTKGAKVW